MPLGQNSTTKFQIGSAEIRMGVMGRAGKLVYTDTLGLLESAEVNFEQQSVDLKGGLPKTLIDTRITETVVTVTANAYEFSRKNIMAMLNEGAGTGTTGPVTAKTSTVTTAISSNPTSATTLAIDGSASGIVLADIVTVGSATSASPADLVVVYQKSNPQNFSVFPVQSASNSANVTTLTINAGDLLHTVAVGDAVFLARQVGLGKSVATQYFTMDIIGTDNKYGGPVGFRFWKAAVGGSMKYAFSNDNYAVTPMTFKILLPSSADLALTSTSTNSGLSAIAGIQQYHPFGLYWGGGDA